MSTSDITQTKKQSSMLDITSKDKGLLIPHIVLKSAGDITTFDKPAKSLMVYNTGDVSLTYKGFVFWNGSEWHSINNTTTLNPKILGLNCTSETSCPLTFSLGVPFCSRCFLRREQIQIILLHYFKC